MLSVVATSGANVLTVWQDFGTRGTRGHHAAPASAVRPVIGTAFDYDSARFGDFDNDGRDDILLQNDTGDLTILRTNSSGRALEHRPASARCPPASASTAPATSTARAGDDILLRSPTQVAVLPMNGVTPQPHGRCWATPRRTSSTPATAT